MAKYTIITSDEEEAAITTVTDSANAVNSGDKPLTNADHVEIRFRQVIDGYVREAASMEEGRVLQNWRALPEQEKSVKRQEIAQRLENIAVGPGAVEGGAIGIEATGGAKP